MQVGFLVERGHRRSKGLRDMMCNPTEELLAGEGVMLSAGGAGGLIPMPMAIIATGITIVSAVCGC